MSSGSTSAVRQLWALIALRMRMVRSGRAQLGFLLLAALVPGSLYLAASVARWVPDERAVDFGLLAPTAFLGFAVLSLVSPLTSGGGQELYPPEQLVAFPVTPRTLFLAALTVLPLNLAWLVQLLAVVASTYVLLPLREQSPLGAVALGLFVLAVSALGQLMTWSAVGARRTRLGRLLVWTTVGVVGLAVVLGVRVLGGTRLLDLSPTTDIVISVLNASGGDHDELPVLALLLAVGVTALAAGHRVCSWALRRPGDSSVFRESRAVARRRDDRSSLKSLDRASIWRSPALRRGVVVLGLLPGGISAVLGVDWPTLVILPGLVAAGAALLFGVNAFCLDGTGAVWLASLPHDPSTAIRAKTRVLAEACSGAVLLAVLAGLLRVDRLPTESELSAVVCAGVASVACVVGTCLRWSTQRPHKAELRGPRDTPAPPGAMAVYSLRLAVGMTFLGLALSLGARSDVWWLPVLLATPATLLALRRVVAAWSAWDHPGSRARVVTTVAHG